MSLLPRAVKQFVLRLFCISTVICREVWPKKVGVCIAKLKYTYIITHKYNNSKIIVPKDNDYMYGAIKTH